MDAAATITAVETEANVIAFSGEALCFRGFRLLPTARILLHHGEAVEIGSRAFDLLHLLLRSRGAIVEHAEILRCVWPTTTVDDSNLRSQVAYLRRVLGEDRHLLKNVPGRGYVLAADTAPTPAVSLESRAWSSRVSTTTGYSSADQAIKIEVLRALLQSALDQLGAMSAAQDRASNASLS